MAVRRLRLGPQPTIDQNLRDAAKLLLRVERLGRMFTRRTATEIFVHEQDRRGAVLGVVEHVVLLLHLLRGKVAGGSCYA